MMLDPYYKNLISAFKIKTFEPDLEPPKVSFRVFGIVSSKHFQKCRTYVARLHRSLPNEYSEPDFRGMLDVEWNILIKKLKRRTDGWKIWSLKRDVAVFVDNEFLGDDLDLIQYIGARFRMHIAQDFELLGNKKVLEHLKKQSNIGRNFVYFVISIDDRVIGSLLFQLYSDLVPNISELFIRRCLKKQDMGGYAGTPIQRVAKPSWIQCGGWKLKHYTTACENYVVPHDRRGVLSMCNNGKHTNNSTQFFITLDSTPWMDYKYVAFGQLIQGEEVLKTIENTPTLYEAPIKKIEIAKTGEFTMYPTDDPENTLHLNKFLETKCSKIYMHEDVIDPHDVKSELLRRRYKLGYYCALSDLRGYLPFLHLPDYLLYKYIIERVEVGEGEEGPEVYYKPPVRIDEPDEPSHFSFGKCLTKSKRFRYYKTEEGEEEEEVNSQTSSSTSADSSTNTFSLTFSDKIEERKKRTIC